MKQLNYFGTSLDQHGHFLWIASENTLQYNNRSLNLLPFSPEYLNNQYEQNGTVHYITFDDYKIIAIQGSCYDKRPGSHSIFWTQENVSLMELKEALLTIPIIKKIIEQMPFEIKWQEAP
jgi:hypothetical protein